MSHKSRRLMGGMGRINSMAPVPSVRQDPKPQQPPTAAAASNIDRLKAEMGQTSPVVDAPVVAAAPAGLPKKRTRRQLAAKEQLKVQKWLIQNWTMLEKERFPVHALCERVSKETGVPMVTPRGLLTVCKNSEMDLYAIVTVAARRGRPAGKSPNLGVQGALRKVATQLANTQDLVKALFTQLGVPFDPDRTLKMDWLRDFAGGQANAADDYHMG